MFIFKSFLSGALALSQFAQALPQPFPAINTLKSWPVDLEKRNLFDVDKISDDTQKEALKTGLKEAVEVAVMVLEKMDSNDYKDYIGKWFGGNEDNNREIVRQVFKNFVGDNKNGEGAEELGDVVVYDDDYFELDGTLFCQTEKEGKTGTAYYMSRGGKPGMHFCPKFFGRMSKEDYTKDNCKEVEHNRITTNDIGRKFQAANVLHEFMHYYKVGKAATGDAVGDPPYGAFKSYDMKNGVDKDKTTLNADTYVYYAMHIWLTETCGRSFGDPQPDDNDST